MKMWKLILPAAALLLFAGQAVAQSANEDGEREMESRERQYAERLRDAEERMEQAARQIAEITSERLPQLAQIERRFEFSNTPRIGITIDGAEVSGPAEGVVVQGVTPGSAADDVGLRAGDVITSINGESLSADDSNEANKQLLDFMQGVEEGDQLKVEYLRNGNVGSVDVAPRKMEHEAFSWLPDGQQWQVHRAPGVPMAPGATKAFRFDFGFPWAGSSWGSMELVELSEGLGKYFGTDKGLLVVSAPNSDGIELMDGDVIKSIDGREPTDVRHAMRILSSYESGESLKLSIMRDKKKRTLDIEIPTDQRGSLFDPAEVPVRPARAPLPPRAPVMHDQAST